MSVYDAGWISFNEHWSGVIERHGGDKLRNTNVTRQGESRMSDLSLTSIETKNNHSESLSSHKRRTKMSAVARRERLGLALQ